LQASGKGQIQGPQIFPEEILSRYKYVPHLTPTDSQNLVRMQSRPGLDVDKGRIATIQQHPRFQAFLTLNESSMLFLNANSTRANSLDMSVVSARTYENILGIAAEPTPQHTKVVPLAFFCSQHRDYWTDEDGKPSELAMSLLLQLIDRYGDFDPTTLAMVVEELVPTDTLNILSIFGKLLSQLPATVIIILIIDGLRFFWHPAERRNGLVQVIEELVEMYRSGSEATLKFLFANPAQAEMVEQLFTEDETLVIPKHLAAVGPAYFGVVER
jgi:hypothetical protein